MEIALSPSGMLARGAPVRTRSILAGMLVAIALVTALAFWDEERESKAALDDFAAEQCTLAVSVAAAIREKLASSDLAHPVRPEAVLAVATPIARPGAVRVLLSAPGGELTADDGTKLHSDTLERAALNGAASARLSRPEASDLALPARTAVAGLAKVDGAGAPWTAIVVATAQIERDRQLRARWRLVLGVIVTSGLVLAFGGLALRKQRKELELAHALAMTTLRTERDERLVRADKLAMMGALATGIAHEVSTPLGVILGRAEQLLPKQSDDRARRAVEAITEQTERIHGVIRGFLGLARGRAPALERFDPAGLARAAVELVEHRFQKAGVDLSTNVPESLPRVACDARLFEQVLVNLLLNACDACKEGGLVTLVVHGDPEAVTFEVTDDGVGISADDAERVTEPFFTTKPEGKGTGLGLAIASEIVKHHRGTFTIRPRAGTHGTCASVSLPIAPDDDHG